MVPYMPYLIDGHNLIGQLPDISLADPNDEAQLVQKLAGFAARTRQRCVVVFDRGIPGGTSRMSTRSVRVVFASPPANADQVIMRRIRNERNPKTWIVVSSDNQVLSEARRRRMQTIRAGDFADLMQRPEPEAKPGQDEAADVHLSEDEINEWLDLFGKEPE
jgi:predicted RNA-binding protein with PIN domain